MPYEIIDENGSGDTGLKITAPTLAKLFEEAAIGVTSIMSETGSFREKEVISVDIKSASLEDLLIDWLSEVVYLKDARNFLPVRAEISRLDDKGYHLKGVLHGEKIDRKRHPVKVDIKAVTYYNLRLRKKGNDWIGEVVFDL